MFFFSFLLSPTPPPKRTGNPEIEREEGGWGVGMDTYEKGAERKKKQSFFLTSYLCCQLKYILYIIVLLYLTIEFLLFFFFLFFISRGEGESAKKGEEGKPCSLAWYKKAFFILFIYLMVLLCNLPSLIEYVIISIIQYLYRYRPIYLYNT